MGIDYRVLQEAAKWFAVLQSGSASRAEHQAWSAWLEQPEHAARGLGSSASAGSSSPWRPTRSAEARVGFCTAANRIDARR